MSFSGSCLASSSRSEVWQFEFEYCLQVLENRFVAHQPPYFGVPFFLCWFIGGLILCLVPFLWGKVRDLSVGCQHFMMVCWLFFSFATLFDFGCCSLSQKMSFVYHYLPYLRQWFITHLLSALLPFQSLFTLSLHGDQLLRPPPFSSALSAPHPLCCVFLFQFLVITHFFLRGGEPVCPGGNAGLSQG
jgi:hypothetical protein